MSKTTKKQVGFYADDDVAEFLDSLNQNTKTRTINAALRAWRESRQSIEKPGYGNIFESMADWLANQTDPIMVVTKAGQTVAVAHLFKKFLHQEKLRQPSMTWPQIIEAGMTFPIPTPTTTMQDEKEKKAPLMVPHSPTGRCASCQKPISSANAINTPTRGRICRACFELPFPK